MNWKKVCDALQHCGIECRQPATPRPVGGGDISAAWRLPTADGQVFLKSGPDDACEMFEAEAEGLLEIASTKVIRVPQVLAVTRYDGGALLALEWLELGRATADTERLLGYQLAELHRCTQDRYGWYRDNMIGPTPQPNGLSDCWVDFFRQQRLAYQLRLAATNGFDGELQVAGETLLKRLDDFFDGYAPEASLLHGDLWAGNWSCCDGQPLVYDPAVYYGDRETDIAMTRLFGGFGPGFYEAYEERWPLHEGFERRVPLYQLYHVLNHLNLFGGSYLGRALSIIKSLTHQPHTIRPENPR